MKPKITIQFQATGTLLAPADMVLERISMYRSADTLNDTGFVSRFLNPADVKLAQSDILSVFGVVPVLGYIAYAEFVTGKGAQMFTFEVEEVLPKGTPLTISCGSELGILIQARQGLK